MLINLRHGCDKRVFSLGLMAVLAFYAALTGWIMLNDGPARLEVEKKLASQTIPITRDAASHADPHTDSHTQGSSADHAPAHAAPKQAAAKQPSNGALPNAPLDGMTETSGNYKNLPIIRAADSMSPYQAYRRPFMPQPGKHYIALVVNGGPDNVLSARAAQVLPPDVSILISPYADTPDDLGHQLRAGGHEFWLSIPFQTANFPESDPGPQAILSASSLEYNMNNFEWTLSQATGYAGIAGFVDQTFLSARPVLGALAKNGFDRGLAFFDINPSALDQVESMAMRQNTPYAKADVIMPLNADLKDAFETLEALAAGKGGAIAVLPPYPNAIKAAEEWIRTLPGKDLALAPLSALAQGSVATPVEHIKATPPQEPAAATTAPAMPQGGLVAPKSEHHEPAAHH